MSKTFPIDMPEDLFKNKVDPESALHMIREVSKYEVKVTLFDIKDDKAPRPDGFTSKFFKASWDLDTLLGSQRYDKNKEGLVYSAVPPTQVYSPPKKDMSWTGLPEFADDTITDYSRPSPSIESNSSDLQSSNYFVSEHGESSKSIMSKPMIKFVKAAN
nr:hypothetical protein [Tanacetum cinerariifolium]